MVRPTFEYFKFVKQLLRHRSYMATVLTNTFIHSLTQALAVNISYLTTPYGITPSQCSIMSVVLTVFGILSNIVVGILMDKT